VVLFKLKISKEQKWFQREEGFGKDQVVKESKSTIPACQPDNFLLRAFVNFASLHFFTKSLHKKLRGYMSVILPKYHLSTNCRGNVVADNTIKMR
jgi:hypothetical protein